MLMDVTPLDGTDVPPLELPVHLVFKVSLAADALTVATLNYDWFYAMAKSGNASVGVTIDGRQNAVLTASTEDLRTWLLAHAGDEGIFAAPTTLKRKPPAPPM
jgi:hypothetical protein